MIFPLHKPFIVAKNRIILVFHFLKQKRQKKKKKRTTLQKMP